MLAGELAAAGATVPAHIFNATVYNNLSSDYGEAVTVLAARQAPVTFDELIEVMTSHQIQL